MPVYLFWGEDNFRLGRAVEKLREQVLDPAWADFNYSRYPGEALIEALNQAVSAPFGGGGRLVWLEEAKIFTQCSDAQYTELARTLPHIDGRSHLLFTLSGKPDGRLKSTKLVQKTADVREFGLVPPWQEAKLKAQVQQMASEYHLQLSATALQLLAEAVGNDTRRLDNELQKLVCFAPDGKIDADAVTALVSTTAQSSFQLASQLLAGQLQPALRTIDELLRRNEAGLRIVAVLVSQFRTWMLVRVAIESGEREAAAIAATAEIGNPARVYFLQKEVERTGTRQLGAALAALLELEAQLKLGRPERAALEAAAVKIVEQIGDPRSAPKRG